MKDRIVKVNLSSQNPEGLPRECSMSIDLFQNAVSTMGELRDFMRQTGISWDFIKHEIELADHSRSPIDNALMSMDPYSTGPGKSLRDLPSNIF